MKSEAFLALPDGTIYAKGTPWFFHGLEIKGETQGRLFWSLDPCWVEGRDSDEAFERLEDMLANGSSFPMQTSVSKSNPGLEAEVFLIFEKDDLLLLKDAIEVALGQANV